MASYYPDMRYLGGEGDLFPRDIRFDPTDPAHLERNADGSIRFRLITEPGFVAAHVVWDDGSGTPMSLVGSGPRTEVWQVSVPPGDLRRRYTFALVTGDGGGVYRVPAGVANAVERLDRWELDAAAVPEAEVPQWARGAVIYQIFPERFANGDPSLDPPGTVAWGSEPRWLDFQGGDLIGIADHADHLVGLGVDAVYLNPIFTSPSTHRYDAVDYYEVDPHLGGTPAFRHLVDTLHAHHIRVIVDASFNHCHPRFFAFADLVERGPASEYRDWFVVRSFPLQVTVRPAQMEAAGWHADTEEYLEYLRRFEEQSGIGVHISGDPGPVLETSYDAWYGVPSLPRIDLTHPAARDYFLDVARHWVRFGIDGWRMDVARYVDFEFWPRFRSAVKEVDPDAYLLAEVMGDATPWLAGNAFDATMNYTFRALMLDFLARRRCDASVLADGLLRMYAAYAPGPSAASQNLLGSHDTPRFLHEADGDRGALHLATVLQMTLPGAPGLYYGDEVGMTGGEEPGSRGAFPWHDPGSWDREHLAVVRQLGSVRRAHPALRTGTFRTRYAGADLFAFEREADGERLLVVVNRGRTERVWIPTGTVVPHHLWGDGSVEELGAGVVADMPAHGAVIARLTASPYGGAG